MNTLSPKKTIDANFCYRTEFKYTHNNPYHDKLEVFDSFVLRDEEAETNKGVWNEKMFQNKKPIEVEIGTGYGEFMMEYCQKNPDSNFIGLDHRFKRSFALAQKLNRLEHKNFRYLRARGERLEFMFDEDEVQSIFYFFPDPWPKNRHNKKRLFQKPFLNACHKILKPGGTLFIKTDHDGYFDWMLDHLKDEKRFSIELQSRDLRSEFPEHFLSQFTTKFEKIFLAQGTLIKSVVLRNLKG
ncbi:MAG TPA: tRNA (guanosine(46)-N7)-methyltransferase TrmB [Bacteriovoracaceae bacterium]|nr:tRNA (guanosine(46)-N7)-methyltransferase TrmB [Bacteriovoracaceae bacterium]